MKKKVGIKAREASDGNVFSIDDHVESLVKHQIDIDPEFNDIVNDNFDILIDYHLNTVRKHPYIQQPYWYW